MPAYPKHKPFRSDLLRKLAKDCPQCMHCDKYTDVCLAHLGGLKEQKGMGQKADDSYFAFLCLDCHYKYDDSHNYMPYIERLEFAHESFKKSIKWLFDNNNFEVKP